MKKSKVKTLQELKEIIKKLSEEKRNEFYGRIYTRIIGVLAKRLIKYEGYSSTKKILEREIKQIGRTDAQKARKILKIKKIDEEAISKILKFLALNLGFNLEIKNDETYIKNCPFAIAAREMNEPLIAEICSWYCEGVAEELGGDKYEWKGFHDFMRDPTICYFTHRKKK